MTDRTLSAFLGGYEYGRVELQDAAGVAAEDFLLEYLDGKPMSEVAWGRADAAQVAALLELHPLEYTITARPEIIARATATPLSLVREQTPRTSTMSCGSLA